MRNDSLHHDACFGILVSFQLQAVLEISGPKSVRALMSQVNDLSLTVTLPWVQQAPLEPANDQNSPDEENRKANSGLLGSVLLF